MREYGGLGDLALDTELQRETQYCDADGWCLVRCRSLLWLLARCAVAEAGAIHPSSSDSRSLDTIECRTLRRRMKERASRTQRMAARSETIPGSLESQVAEFGLFLKRSEVLLRAHESFNSVESSTHCRETGQKLAGS